MEVGTTEKTESRSVLSEKEEELILEVSCIMDITVTDVERLFNQDTETCLGYLKRLEKKGKLKEVNGSFNRLLCSIQGKCYCFKSSILFCIDPHPIQPFCTE